MAEEAMQLVRPRQEVLSVRQANVHQYARVLKIRCDAFSTFFVFFAPFRHCQVFAGTGGPRAARRGGVWTTA